MCLERWCAIDESVTRVMKNETAAKNKEKWKLAKSCPQFKKGKKKKRHRERQEILFKVIPKEECGTDTSGWEGLNQYSAPPSHSSSNSF